MIMAIPRLPPVVDYSGFGRPKPLQQGHKEQDSELERFPDTASCVGYAMESPTAQATVAKCRPVVTDFRTATRLFKNGVRSS
jgi:hypothetical protein